ncbi:MAG: DUF6516 family protein [Atribacterota bacterium]|jgi:hypothetical protein|uniref:toxin-antitoxin system TumE family protein n=1 Tax=Atribacter sp. TaxID=2847780 RepID=UPI001769896B|nr:DUF6516 family protein [Atribacterota bacterium]HHT08978.1 hypothetical protein [Candidatus Atribacteria bacterium]
MLKKLNFIEKSKIVKSYEILDFKQGKDFYYIKIKLVFTDESEFYVREFISEKDYLYSYHWQNKDGKLRIRWDNAPHHKDMKTFPHHKHSPKLEESTEIGFEEILLFIEEKMKKE